MHLESFIEKFICVAEWENMKSEVFGSKTRFTRIMNRPQDATAADVLRLSDRIKCHPSLLIDQYQMGARAIPADIQQHLKTKFTAEPTVQPAA